MTASDEPIIEARSLSHVYLKDTPLEVHSLFNIDFRLYRNESVGIIGPMGSGKSTLLLHLNGIERPQQGEVFVDGSSLGSVSTDIKKIRQKIGLVFQNPEAQLFERYAGDDVAFGPRNMKLRSEDIRARVREAMQMVGLPFEYKDRLTEGLSQGEKRRLALAGILAMEPEVLVLDEPTASLDPEGRNHLLGILRRWREKGRRALVIATHNMEDIVELCNRVYVLVKGSIILQGSPREIFSYHDLLIENGINVPVAAEIVHRLYCCGYDVSLNVTTIGEAVREIERAINVEKV